MRYPLLLMAVPLFACSAVQGEEQGPQIVKITGADQTPCRIDIGTMSTDSDEFSEVALEQLSADRPVTIKSTPDAHFGCVTGAQQVLINHRYNVTIDEASWQNMTSVKDGAFVPTEEIDHPEATPYDKSRDAAADIDAALERAGKSGNNLILVMGANWCHDSRGLAGWFATPRFARLLSKDYEVVYVDVGFKDRNIDIAQSYGIEKIKGTPTVLVVSPEAQLLNHKSAPTWRNAASREEDAIFDYFDQFKPES